MPRRTLIELLHIAAGLVAAVLIAKLSAWSYPLGRSDIWIVAWVAMGVIVAMGVGPLRRAIAVDREATRGKVGNG